MRNAREKVKRDNISKSETERIKVGIKDIFNISRVSQFEATEELLSIDLI